MKSRLLCLVCGESLRYAYTKLEREIYHCPGCRHSSVPAGLVIRNDGKSIYESADSIFNEDGNQDYYLDESTFIAAKAKVDYVSRFASSDARLLDVGAGFGHFVKTASDSFAADGVEVSPQGVSWAKDNLGINLIRANLDTLNENVSSDYDVVTSWDVIEHLESPREAIRAMSAVLRPGGMLFLSSPDAGSLVARVMGQQWHYLDPVQHINLFSLKNIARVLEEEGFEIVAKTHFGHSYRISYVINRLNYLFQSPPLSWAVWPLTLIPTFIQRLSIPLKLWDVFGVVARKKE